MLLKKICLGVDLGATSIKMVELAKEGDEAKLLSYGYSEQSIEITRKNAPGQEEKIVSIIKKIQDKAKFRSRRVVSAMPSFAVFSSIINLPEMSKKDLQSAVYWEAKKFIPIPIEEVILDWKILEEKSEGKIQKTGLSKKGFYDKNKSKGRIKERKEDTEEGKENKEEGRAKFSLKEVVSVGEKEGGKNFRILLTAAPRDLVEKYVKVFRLAKLELLSLETESFALSRALVGRDPGVVMVVDFGAKTTDIIIIERGIPIFSRSIDIGGENITQAISSSLKIDRKKAEQFKMDLSLVAEERVPKVIRDILESMINEIRYSLDLYTSQNKKNVEKIILSGGTASLPDIPQYLSKVLDMNVYIGDPWANVTYPIELEPILKELGPRFAVAVGLAMRGIE